MPCVRVGDAMHLQWDRNTSLRPGGKGAGVGMRISGLAERPWLDGDGCFLFGKYQGEDVVDVAGDDPGYLQWIMDEVRDCPDDDLEIFQAHLERHAS